MDDDGDTLGDDELVGLVELVADADALAVGDAVRDGVGLTVFDGCGLPAGLGDADGRTLARLGLGDGLEDGLAW